MCKNGRNKCSWIVAMDKAGEGDKLAEIFERMVNGKKKEKSNASC